MLREFHEWEKTRPKSKSSSLKKAAGGGGRGMGQMMSNKKMMMNNRLNEMEREMKGMTEREMTVEQRLRAKYNNINNNYNTNNIYNNNSYDTSLPYESSSSSASSSYTTPNSAYNKISRHDYDDDDDDDGELSNHYNIDEPIITHDNDLFSEEEKQSYRAQLRQQQQLHNDDVHDYEDEDNAYVSGDEDEDSDRDDAIPSSISAISYRSRG
jgi:hypothetical protein